MIKLNTYHMVFTATAVQHAAQKQLSSNAAQRPHVDGCCVRNSQDDFWSPFREKKYICVLFGFSIFFKNHEISVMYLVAYL